MSKRSGKTLTVFLVVIFILLVSVAAIAVFFYFEEARRIEELEAALAQVQSQYSVVENDLKETGRQKQLLDQKLKEAETEIERLEGELDLREGLAEEFKKEKQEIEASLTGLTKRHEELKTKMADDAQEHEASLQDLRRQLAEAITRYQEAEKRVSEGALVSSSGSNVTGGGGVQLETIVVNPGVATKGKIVSIDNEADFVIVRLGQQDGLTEGMLLEVRRDDQYIGDLRVTRVQQDMAAADFVPPLTSQGVSLDDLAVIKEQ